MIFTGEVTNMDTAAKMMTVKGKKGDMTFDVSGVKMKGEAKAGDKVTVKYMEKEGKMMASSVTMGGAKTTKKTTTKQRKRKKKLLLLLLLHQLQLQQHLRQHQLRQRSNKAIYVKGALKNPLTSGCKNV